MTFDYNQSVWGQDTASLSPTHPTAFRLSVALEALQKLPANAKILEVGCGAGQFIRAIKHYLPNSECYGFDVSSVAIASAQNNDKSVNYIAGAADRWPLENNFFDAVVIFDVLEHVESVEQTLAEIRRVLKTDGLIYAFIPCEGDYLSFWHYLQFSKKFRTLTTQYAGHINRYSRAVWYKIFDTEGFKIVGKRYSEHFFGQLLGVLSFYLMDRRAQNKNLSQLNNEEFFTTLAKETEFKKLFNLLRAFVNLLVYYESKFFQKLPSPNIHLVLKKR